MVVFQRISLFTGETVFKLPKGGICNISGLQLPRRLNDKNINLFMRGRCAFAGNITGSDETYIP